MAPAARAVCTSATSVWKARRAAKYAAASAEGAGGTAMTRLAVSAEAGRAVGAVLVMTVNLRGKITKENRQSSAKLLSYR
ncbi:hypothetical protein GCM10010324_48380 [Streptomyces hiroshimensis]|uniref:Uncharacterized protein n=1 Tax=Streptomyces hiroshimensis TaxID=66424 RepID=A0ABQ2YVI5_9ACTN|nr:hypothetical protein GCM10010324_48380 [Streptomyces hiroshimensis]